MMERCWLEISTAALLHNAAALNALLPLGAKIAAVVKADAYGHGVGIVVPALADQVAVFAVANLHEAHEIRRYNSNTPVLILSPALPDEREVIVRNGFLPSVSSVEEAAAYGRHGSPGNPVPLHLVIDTGMGRMGVWQEDARQAIASVVALTSVKLSGIATHLPVSDEDDLFTIDQLARFQELLADQKSLIDQGNTLPHVLNSAGILTHASGAAGLVRAGLALYGLAPVPTSLALRPVLSWKTRVVLVREIGPGRSISYGRTFVSKQAMRVATLSVGYADGYLRSLSGRETRVLVGGQFCPLIGRVTMDQIVVDVSALTTCKVGDEAVLIGRQGENEIPAQELATRAGTISWEILTAAGAGVRGPRLVTS